MRDTYRTRQGEEILRIISRMKGKHLTAAMLRDRLAESGMQIAPATIYRRLGKLVDEGVVRKYYLESEIGACYEYVGPQDACASHFHCKCEQCGQLIHMDCDELNEIRRHLMDEHGFSWNSGKTVFYGICDQCR